MTRLYGALAPAAALLLVFTAAPAGAGNGMNGYGTGARSMGMAGADLAIPNGIYSIATNPAGLGHIRGHEASAYIEPWWQPLRHSDDLGNDKEVNNTFAGIFGGGYAQTVDAEQRITVGVAAFAQGGTGFVYKNLKNAFGAPDEMSALFGVFRLAPAVSWRASDQLILGAILGINYSSAEQKFLPDTSIPGFQGFSLDKADGFSFNGKLGLLYQPAPAWTLALSYTSRTPLKLEGGDLLMNHEADGLGRVRYRNASVSGLSLPAELGFGLAFAANDSWDLSAEINWLDWSRAARSSRLSADSPDRDGVPETVSLSSPLEWRDQYVVAIGAQHQWSPTTQLRFGYNYGRNPVPDRNLSPNFNLISEHAFAVGLGRSLTQFWQMDVSLLASPFRSERYSNPSLGLGTEQKERFAVFDINVTLTRRW